MEVQPSTYQSIRLDMSMVKLQYQDGNLKRVEQRR